MSAGTSPRWALIHDDEDTYLCPADRVEEARAMLAALGAYWADDDLEAEEMGPPPPSPDFLEQVEGELLTFERPELNGEPAGGTREPTLSDLLDHLRARPATAEQLLGSLQVAQAWSDLGQGSRARWPVVVRYREDAVLDETPAVCHVYYQDETPLRDGAWRASVLDQDLDQDFPTRAAAETATDKLATELGWVLVGAP